MCRFNIGDPLSESTPLRTDGGKNLQTLLNSHKRESSLYAAARLPRFGKSFQSRKDARHSAFG
jgi:hypothetical protein